MNFTLKLQLELRFIEFSFNYTLDEYFKRVKFDM